MLSMKMWFYFMTVKFQHISGDYVYCQPFRTLIFPLSLHLRSGGPSLNLHLYPSPDFCAPIKSIIPWSLVTLLLNLALLSVWSWTGDHLGKFFRNRRGQTAKCCCWKCSVEVVTVCQKNASNVFNSTSNLGAIKSRHVVGNFRDSQLAWI